MKTQILVILYVLILCSTLKAQIPFECTGQNFVSISDGSSTFIYDVKIDAFSGSVNFNALSSTPTGVLLNAIGYRSKDNFIYGMRPSDNRLYKVDRNGAAFFVGNIVGLTSIYYAGAVTSDGRFLTLLSRNNDHLAFIDLEDSNLEVTITSLTRDNGQSITSSATDIAYDQLSGDIYAFDSNNKKLIRIDITTATVYQDEFPTTNVANRIGACFFDVFGTFYGYGNSFSSSSATELFSADISTGLFTRIGTGPVASEKDGCSCPYTISLQKTVYPETIFQCTDAKYKFYIANGTGTSQEGVDLIDELPEGLTVKEVTRNPFGGTVTGIGTRVISITDMVVPIGRDSISVVVTADPFTEGIYKNQARLEDLPERLGGTVLSDYPYTPIIGDSTILEIIPLINDLENTDFFECDLDSILINAGTYGVTYVWHDGTTDSTFYINEPGLYWVEISTGCETVRDTIFAYEPDIPVEVDAGLDTSVILGDGYPLFANVNIMNPISFIWEEIGENTLSCYSCPDPNSLTYFDNAYTVTVTDEFGCTASDVVNIRVDKDFTTVYPNIFSPNNDLVNDIFYITTRSLGKLRYLKIFDRWGNLVHQRNSGFTNDPAFGWNGEFNGKLVNPGVFVFVAEIEFLDGYTELVSGDLTAVR